MCILLLCVAAALVSYSVNHLVFSSVVTAGLAVSRVSCRYKNGRPFPQWVGSADAAVWVSGAAIEQPGSGLVIRRVGTRFHTLHTQGQYGDQCQHPWTSRPSATTANLSRHNQRVNAPLRPGARGLSQSVTVGHTRRVIEHMLACLHSPGGQCWRSLITRECHVWFRQSRRLATRSSARAGAGSYRIRRARVS